MPKSLKFIDLFAGVGGFHVGLSSLGHKCVFACELDPILRDTYTKNFGISPAADICAVHTTDIPAHDILCAGFPCQPFSKAGAQSGFGCPRNGSLFDHVLRIIKWHRPKFVLLENVPNLQRHDAGKTWQVLYEGLKGLGYDPDANLMSPHQHGIPQKRQRIFIVARLGSLGSFSWPKPRTSEESNTVFSVLDHYPSSAKRISPQVTKCLEVWQDFLDRIPKSAPLPSWPIWAMEFGATYPFEKRTPFAIGKRALRSYKGSFGRSLDSRACADPFDLLPSHARTEQHCFPRWKVHFIGENRRFYETHKRHLKSWLKSVEEFPSSLQKLEWNCQGEERNIWKFIVQMRASGVRLKRPSSVPSLVAMTTTQVPIVAWEQRYMTVKECSRVQSLACLRYWPKSDDKSYKALGNAVNAKLITLIASMLVGKANGRSASNRLRRPNYREKAALLHA